MAENKKCTISLGVGIDGSLDGTSYKFYCEDLASLFNFEYEFELDNPIEAILGKGKSTVSLALESVNKISAAASFIQGKHKDQEGDQLIKSAWSKLPAFKGIKPITFKSQIDLKFYWGIDNTFNPKTEVLDKVIYLMDYFAPARSGAQITPPLPVNSTLLASTLKNMAISNLTPDESSNNKDKDSKINDSKSEIDSNKSEIKSSEESNNGPEATKVDGNLLSSLATELAEIIQSFNKAIKDTFSDKNPGYGKIFCQISCGKLKSPVFFPKGVSIEFDTSSVVLFDGKMYPIGATVSLKNCQTPLLPYKGLVSNIGLTDKQFKEYYAYKN